MTRWLAEVQRARLQRRVEMEASAAQLDAIRNLRSAYARAVDLLDGMTLLADKVIKITPDAENEIDVAGRIVEALAQQPQGPRADLLSALTRASQVYAANRQRIRNNPGAMMTNDIGPYISIFGLASADLALIEQQAQEAITVRAARQG